jgi:hypothetical protein
MNNLKLGRTLKQPVSLIHADDVMHGTIESGSDFPKGKFLRIGFERMIINS